MLKLDTYIISEIGTRNDMQDRHCLYFSKKADFFIGGVYDGHGGTKVADNASKIIPKEFLKLAGKGLSVTEAFKKAYKIASETGGHNSIGSTALTFLVKDNKLVVANTGDSRMVMINGQEIHPLTVDHHLRNKDELKRLHELGAMIKRMYVFKGDRGINISRSIGNLDMKDIGVTEEPDVFFYDLPEKFTLIAASDGLWGYLKNEKVAEIALYEQSSEIICHKLMHTIFKISRKFNYMDNTTIIVIKN